MSALINLPRAAWKRQPSMETRLDLSQVRASSYVGGIPISAVLLSTGQIAGGAFQEFGRNSNGNAWKTQASSNTYWTLPVGKETTRSLTMIWQGVLITAGFPILRDKTPTGGTILLANEAGKYDVRLGGINYAEAGNWAFNTTQTIVVTSGLAGVRLFANGQLIISSATLPTSAIPVTPWHLCKNGDNLQFSKAETNLFLILPVPLPDPLAQGVSANPWQLFKPIQRRFYLIPSSGGATTYTDTLSIDALIQRAGLTQSTTIDALLQSAFSRSLSLDGLIAAVQTGVISLDALLQIVGTRTVSIDALLQATKAGTVSVDALVQMTLSQSLSLDALIVAASASSASVSLDALIQSLKTAGVSLDALLSKSMSATSVIDALIQASKAGTVSLDAIITGASGTAIFVGLDALIQAIQSKTLSLDALLQKTYTNILSLDAYVALTRVQSVSLDALIQASKTGVVSLDALIQMTRTVTVSFDALIQSAKTGVISLDAILVFATQASVLLDAYVQKAVLRGVGLDAIIGAIADMVMPTGRVVAVPASDRWVFVTPSDRFIQV